MNTETLTRQQLIERITYYNQFLTDGRKRRIADVLANRTRYITVVLEDIYQPHNASAVLRSCDGFGIQDIHVIENRNSFHPHKSVELGTSQWLTIKRYREQENNTAEAITRLKEDGYRIIATSPHNNDVDLEELEVESGKMALLFGTELTGLSSIALDMADEYMKIPMYGFVESFNISVSCAISLHHLSHKLRSSPIDFALTEREQLELLHTWTRGSIRHPERHDHKFL